MLEEALRKYRNRGIEAAQVIDELTELAREMRVERDWVWERTSWHSTSR